MATPAPLRDSRADAAKRKRERRSQHRDKAFTAWMHQFPCSVCGRYGAEQHHQPYRSAADWHDRRSLMLCPEHHRGGTGIHLLGKQQFENLHGIDIESRIESLNKRYEGEKK